MPAGTRFTTSHYGSTPGLQVAAGVYNLNVFADLENKSDPAAINNRIEAALADADSRIFAAFAVANQSVPDASSPYFKRLATVANYYALTFLYRPRALNDKNLKGYMEMWKSAADEEIGNIIWALSRDLCVTTTPKTLVNDHSIAATMTASLPMLPGVW